MDRFRVVSVLVPLLALPATAQEVRQLGPHVHGESHLQIAVEGRTLQMELHAPAADIVGFETVPATDSQRAAVAAAGTLLRDPLALFGIPAAAGCALGSVDVSLEEEAPDAAPRPGAPSPAARHAEFHAEYHLACTNLPAITGLNFAFFSRFPNATVLRVDVLSTRGSFSFEATRAAPMVSTRNMF
jgi:hypothetical protein